MCNVYKRIGKKLLVGRKKRELWLVGRWQDLLWRKDLLQCGKGPRR